MVDVDFRTPDEQEILDKFDAGIVEGEQWQVWYGGKLKDTFWTREEAEYFAEHIWTNGIGGEEIRFKEYWGGSFAESVRYFNLEVQSPDGRWMTSKMFIVRVKISNTIHF